MVMQQSVGMSDHVEQESVNEAFADIHALYEKFNHPIVHLFDPYHCGVDEDASMPCSKYRASIIDGTVKPAFTFEKRRAWPFGCFKAQQWREQLEQNKQLEQSGRWLLHFDYTKGEVHRDAYLPGTR